MCERANEQLAISSKQINQLCQVVPFGDITYNCVSPTVTGFSIGGPTGSIAAASTSFVLFWARRALEAYNPSLKESEVFIATYHFTNMALPAVAAFSVNPGYCLASAIGRSCFTIEAMKASLGYAAGQALGETAQCIATPQKSVLASAEAPQQKSTNKDNEVCKNQSWGRWTVNLLKKCTPTLVKGGTTTVVCGGLRALEYIAYMPPP